MESTLPALTAILLYLAGTSYQIRANTTTAETSNNPLLLLGFMAITAHGISLFNSMHSFAGIDLGFYKVGSLISWLIATLLLISSLKKPVESLVILLFPIAAISILLTLFLNSDALYVDKKNVGHILLSILAYSLLTIAMLQSIALAYQDKQLRLKHNMHYIHKLPPLQTMESLLFQMIWLGMILLSLSIATGFIFLEDMFAQKHAHKTILSLAAWVVFAILLWGRHYLGWRSTKAINWTLTGFILLMLAYFGSKLVKEIIL